MLKILICASLSVALYANYHDVYCEDCMMYKKYKNAKKVIKKNRGDIPDYVLQDAVKGYLERPSEYQEEPFYWRSELHEKRKGRHHDEK